MCKKQVFLQTLLLVPNSKKKHFLKLLLNKVFINFSISVSSKYIKEAFETIKSNPLIFLPY